jgi:hypothetical protein
MGVPIGELKTKKNKIRIGIKFLLPSAVLK